ncbi:hypothetical protein H4R35_007398, partial [Dimargaris xerosporica]
MARVSIGLLAAAAALAHAAFGQVASKYKTRASSQPKSTLLNLPPEILVDHILPLLPGRPATHFGATAQQPLALMSNAIRYHGGEVFYRLRHRLGLPPVRGPPTLVGLRTLLDGAHFEFRGMAFNFLEYFQAISLDTDDSRLYYEAIYPDLFLKYSFQDMAIPNFVKPWINVEFSVEDIPPDSVRHSIAKLGLDASITQLGSVVEALFAVLSSPDLLDNFRTITTRMFPKQQRSQGAHPVNPAPTPANPAKHQQLYAFMHQLWLEVIGGGNLDQLRYYLCNMLAFDVIPSLLGQVLESGRHAE